MNFSFSFRSFLVLKYSVIAVWLVVWNALIGMGVYLNGGGGRIKTLSAMLLLLIATIGTATFCFCIVFSEKARKILLHKERGQSYEAAPFVFLGVLATFLALANTLSSPL